MKNKTLLTTLTLFLLLQTRSTQAMDIIYKYPYSVLVASVKIMRSAPSFFWRNNASKNDKTFNSSSLFSNSKDKKEKYKRSHEDDNELDISTDSNKSYMSRFLGYFWYNHGWNTSRETDRKIKDFRSEINQIIEIMNEKNEAQHNEHQSNLMNLKKTTEEKSSKQLSDMILLGKKIEVTIVEISEESKRTKDILHAEQKRYKKSITEKFKTIKRTTNDLSMNFSNFYKLSNETLDTNIAELNAFKIDFSKKIAAINLKVKEKKTIENKQLIVVEAKKIEKAYSNVKEIAKLTPKNGNKLQLSTSSAKPITKRFVNKNNIILNTSETWHV